jgi:hypothetical protein
MWVIFPWDRNLNQISFGIQCGLCYKQIQRFDGQTRDVFSLSSNHLVLCFFCFFFNKYSDPL